MKKVIILFWCSVFLLFIPQSSRAWGVLGHRVVGGIAERHLTDKARAAIRNLLGNESVALASTYADFIRSDNAYRYLDTWHYINVPEGLSPAQLTAYLQKDTGTDLYTRMGFLVKELKNKQLARDKQVFYLKMLIHLAGDAHQPLHVGRAADRGGNDIKLNWFNTPSNLHRVWDEQLVEFQQLSYTEHIAAIDFSTAAQRRQWQQQPMSEWIVESYQHAARIYASAKAEDRLSYRYNYDFVNMMNSQLLKGGIRLAGLLNEIYGR